MKFKNTDYCFIGSIGDCLQKNDFLVKCATVAVVSVIDAKWPQIISSDLFFPPEI